MTNEERAREAATEIAKADPDWDTPAEIILAALNAATAELEEERGRLREAFAEIEALRAISDAATKGPWRHYRSPLRPGGVGSTLIVNEIQKPGQAPIVKWSGFDECRREKKHAANAALIVAAVNTIRSALAKKDPSNG